VSRPRVVIYRPADESGASHRELAAAGCEVVLGRPDLEPGELTDLVIDADALMGASFRSLVLDRALLESLPRLRIVSKYTIGVDDIDVDAATELGIIVAYCPTEANWGGVAEGAIAFMLTLLKRVRERDRHVKAGGWRDPALRGTHLGARDDGYPGITIGLVGLGRIGSRVADLLAPWRVRLLACDPYVPESKFRRHHAERVDLMTLLEASDVVSLHCNLTAETRGLIRSRELYRMKPGAFLVNTARGPLLDLDSLCEAIEAGRLAGAALDVLPEEPPPPDARVLHLGDRVLLCPHMAAANAGGTLAAAVPWATEATLSALRGVVPKHVANPEVLERWRARFAARLIN
jgi:D-3-phosphoglycerate dehydrogenase / 2-oxoglutarate reductase